MKKLFLIPLVMLCSIVHAQIQLGVKAGVNISNFTGGDFSNVEKSALVGFHGGGLVRIHLGKLVLQPELLFSSQGAKLSQSGKETDFKISYCTIPIMLQWQSVGGFYLEAGPQAGFRVSENVPDSINGHFAKSSDLSIDFGLGYVTKMGLGIGGRYTVGVSKVGDFDAANIDPDFKNAVIQISLFYYFFGKKKKKEEPPKQ